MAVEQKQGYCNRCAQHTLHTRTSPQPNHVLHLLVSLFLCGLWIPIWIILTLAAGSSQMPWLCSRCGQPEGQMTPEQLAEHARQTALTPEQQRELERQRAYGTDKPGKVSGW